MSKQSDKLFQQLKRQTGKAIGDFKLIEEGDKIAVAVSGGKDSYLLLDILEELRKRAPVEFELIAVNIDSGFPGYRTDIIEQHLRERGHNYRIKRIDAYQIISEKRKPNSSYCAFCARLRRGALYTLADELGCNKIALGHHLDDFIETLLLNQFYVGTLAAMSPKLLADNGKQTVIRPLVYVEEADISEYSRLIEYPLICCSCPVAGGVDQKRQRMKQLINDLAEEIPQIRNSMISALGNVQLRHLLDKESPLKEKR
ncbi:tRNA 2-thiocytidine biosynthesis protein TtcA [Malonomonas rubra DSM 5091]|uniref:tRNA 2-thiocytidine biosynthesis protein TtcA n=1 Tax=Malonomonas rubra DSM 5091 TaxID=1122189 RepID=A0A1M6I0E4_MALRU|nr:tRNA 2-thiocytidine(32) synthetase TtcA [Malonomonas rubra]SHJ27992.1 tRNA 2-thiocytidine biosynthesis protein TtcA [Malonomonas rubra DSM 5091]